ncbi:hypothetical protein KIKIMORA_04150 [Brevundimonas phage vB_BpoS-Kikimora]|uniref:Uncharacterized protein n=1 Tax=Brevundimonas phage vB_BpoS-Kikimora TaxID=2948601 RepID=A0A9E7SKH6_9CAUD|nr:hypothetical protein KIKIMORA_04150 [Brevundimonas phage vB_BpoS-Kikimora]
MPQVDALLLKWPAPVQSTRRLAWALAYKALYAEVDLMKPTVTPDELAAEATRRSFLYESQANQLIQALKEACERGL